MSKRNIVNVCKLGENRKTGFFDFCLLQTHHTRAASARDPKEYGIVGPHPMYESTIFGGGMPVLSTSIGAFLFAPPCKGGKERLIVGRAFDRSRWRHFGRSLIVGEGLHGGSMKQRKVKEEGMRI